MLFADELFLFCFSDEAGQEVIWYPDFFVAVLAPEIVPQLMSAVADYSSVRCHIVAGVAAAGFVSVSVVDVVIHILGGGGDELGAFRAKSGPAAENIYCTKVKIYIHGNYLTIN